MVLEVARANGSMKNYTTNNNIAHRNSCENNRTSNNRNDVQLGPSSTGSTNAVTPTFSSLSRSGQDCDGDKFPPLSMLIDRSSFDETDDYGVDPGALVPWAKVLTSSKTTKAVEGEKPQDSQPIATQAIVMKDGKIRRRLQWRPKVSKKNNTSGSLTNQQQQQQNRKIRSSIPANLNGSRRNFNSSNSSVVSSGTFSQASKHSKKSLHSFASTETAAMSNLNKDKLKKRLFPLPTQNYSTHLDDHSSGTNTNNLANTSTPQQSTIGTEGGFVHARIVGWKYSNTAAVSYAKGGDNGEGTEVVVDDAISDHHKDQDLECHQQPESERMPLHNETISLASLQQSSSSPTVHNITVERQRHQSPKSPRLQGLPPLFQRNNRQKQQLRQPHIQQHYLTSRSHLPPLTSAAGDSSVVSVLSFASSQPHNPNYDNPHHDTDDKTTATSSTATSTSTTSTAPVPVLSDDEVEIDRRVDLRIVRGGGNGTTNGLFSFNKQNPIPNATSTVEVGNTATSVTTSVALVNENPGNGSSSSSDPTTEPVASDSAERQHQLTGANSPPILSKNKFHQLITSSLMTVFSGEAFFISSSRSDEAIALSNSLISNGETIGNMDETAIVPNESGSMEKATADTKSSTPITFSSSPSSLVLPQRPLFYGGSNSASEDDEDVDNADVLRFSMSSTDSTGYSGGEFDRYLKSQIQESARSSDNLGIPAERRANTSKLHHTGPVDVDDVTFLEAEKNLHAIHEMAIEHLQQGEYTEALEVFEEILRGQLTRYGEDHHRVGTALHNIGVVHMRRGDYHKAQIVYKEAVRVRKMALEPGHPDIAVSLAQLGVAYLEIGKLQRAIGAFRDALKIRRKCYGNHHPKVAKILNNIGCGLYDLNELEVARVAFEEALEILRHSLRTTSVPSSSVIAIQQQSKNTTADTEHDTASLREDENDPNRNSTNDDRTAAALLSIASTQCNIASIKLYSGEFEEASVDLEEALLIQQCVLGDDHPLVRRTHESLLWLENQRSSLSPQQTKQNFQITASTTKQSFSSPRSSERSNVDALATAMIATGRSSGRTTTAPITVTMVSPNNENSAHHPASCYTTSLLVDENCYPTNDSYNVFDSIERGFRRLQADLSYNPCGAMDCRVDEKKYFLPQELNQQHQIPTEDGSTTKEMYRTCY